jgi:hypothetical protein
MITTIPGITIVAPSGRVASAIVMRLGYPLRVRQTLCFGHPFDFRFERCGAG